MFMKRKIIVVYFEWVLSSVIYKFILIPYVSQCWSSDLDVVEYIFVCSFYVSQQVIHGQNPDYTHNNLIITTNKPIINSAINPVTTSYFIFNV